ncbi:MAG: hypothetical protein IKQ04_09335 [Oscillospiraceae bacterium]|nr:hypothetical protein [Oscillospiraceae bacterium]MBR7011247.1 hypothetical protein [Oscillospiraceae bacterium]
MTKTTTQRETAPVSLWVKLQTGLLAGVLILLLALVLMIGSAAGRIEQSFQLVQRDLESLEMEEINQAVTALREAADRLAAVDAEGLNRTAQSLKAAADSLTRVDVDTLNGAIASLREAADTLKSLDMEALNNVVQSLNKTVASLQKVSDTISGIFH